MPFPSIIPKFGIERDWFLLYQQLKFLIQSKITLTNTLQPFKITERLLEEANHPRTLISKLDSFIHTVTLQSHATSRLGFLDTDLQKYLYCDYQHQITTHTI